MTWDMEGKIKRKCKTTPLGKTKDCQYIEFGSIQGEGWGRNHT